MCEPGTYKRTDAELASSIRHHLSAILIAKKHLNERGYSVSFRNGANYMQPVPETVEIEKVVKL